MGRKMRPFTIPSRARVGMFSEGSLQRRGLYKVPLFCSGPFHISVTSLLDRGL